MKRKKLIGEIEKKKALMVQARKYEERKIMVKRHGLSC